VSTSTVYPPKRVSAEVGGQHVQVKRRLLLNLMIVPVFQIGAIVLRFTGSGPWGLSAKNLNSKGYSVKKALVCAVAILVSSSALATPVISGKYIVTERRMCQAVATFSFDNTVNTGDFVNGVNLNGGIFKNSLVLANFSPAKGKVTVDGLDEGGDAMLFAFTGAQNGQQGNVMAESANSGKVDYSNTDTTVTINGETYHVLYGQVDKNNIAHYFAMEGVFINDSNELCSAQADASRQ